MKTIHGKPISYFNCQTKLYSNTRLLPYLCNVKVVRFHKHLHTLIPSQEYILIHQVLCTNACIIDVVFLATHDKIVKGPAIYCIQFSLSHNHRIQCESSYTYIHYPSEENSISDEQYDGALCCVQVQRWEIFWLLYECLETVSQVVYESTRTRSFCLVAMVVRTSDCGLQLCRDTFRCDCRVYYIMYPLPSHSLGLFVFVYRRIASFDENIM